MPKRANLFGEARTSSVDLFGQQPRQQRTKIHQVANCSIGRSCDPVVSIGMWDETWDIEWN